jgi:hypothetical protein
MQEALVLQLSSNSHLVHLARLARLHLSLSQPLADHLLEVDSVSSSNNNNLSKRQPLLEDRPSLPGGNFSNAHHP